MNLFDDGSSGTDIPGGVPPVDGEPEPSSPGELNGIESGGEYYSGVTLLWTEDDSMSIRAFVRNVTEAEAFFEVSYGYQIDLKPNEQSAEYEVKLEVALSGTVAEKTYRFTIFSPSGPSQNPLVVTGIERNGVYSEPVSFSWTLNIPDEPGVVATAVLKRALSDEEWAYDNGTFYTPGTVVSQNGSYLALITYPWSGGTTTAFYPFTVSISDGVPAPVITGVQSVPFDYSPPRFPSWIVPPPSSDIVTTAVLTLQGAPVSDFSPGTKLEIAGDYQLTVTYSRGVQSNSTSVSFSIKPPTPTITFLSQGNAGTFRGNAQQFYKSVDVSWDDFLPGSRRLYRVTYWEDPSDPSGDVIEYDSDLGGYPGDSYAVTENGIYRFEVHYFQNGKHNTWTRSLELRLIPEPNLQIAEQLDGTFLVSWVAPPDYVEVSGIYFAIDADDGLYSDEFTGTDVGGNS
ncbi:MAG: hypothetical protein MI724_03325, partial [Spirochaetales bacterium]|nr:hypothetical protein [Spirochaetales bacterium]